MRHQTHLALRIFTSETIVSNAVYSEESDSIGIIEVIIIEGTKNCNSWQCYRFEASTDSLLTLSSTTVVEQVYDASQSYG